MSAVASLPAPARALHVRALDGTDQERFAEAFEVADDWHGRGLATALLRSVMARARESGLERLIATTMVDNRAARRVLRKAGFSVRACADGLLELELDLDESPGAVAA